MKTQKYICLVLAVILCAGVLSGCGVIAKRVEYNSFADLQNAGEDVTIGFDETLGILESVHETFPQAQIAYYNEINGYQAISSGKCDAYIGDGDAMKTAIRNGLTGVKVLDEPFNTNYVVCAISPSCKIPDFKNRVNEFIARLKADGTLDDIYQRWLRDGNYEMPELPFAEDPEYTLTVTTVGSEKPFSFYENGQLAGSEVEIAYRLGAELNAKVIFEVADWDGMVAGVVRGKYDICISNLYYAPEREGNVIFSDPYYEAQLCIMVRDFADENGGFFKHVATGIENTLISGNRWKMMLSGLGVTMIITLGGFLLANILGAVLCAMAMSHKKGWHAFENAYSKIMQGMPIVVALMILYYILFANLKVSGILIAILGFGITGGAYMAQLFKVSLQCVGSGQKEAALAMGAGKAKVFREIVLPQAAIYAMPGYFSQLISMMKETAIVGYIAVMDLTKASDIVRGATFDAFTPLITAAVVYILIASILIAAMNAILKSISPKLKKRVLKGVRVK